MPGNYNLFALGISNIGSQVPPFVVGHVVKGTTSRATAIVSTANTGATTIQVSSADTFIRSTGSFITDGFSIGQGLITDNFTNAVNNSVFKVKTVSEFSLSIEESTLIVETGTGDETMIAGVAQTSGRSGSLYAAYKDLWERVNEGQVGLVPTLTELQVSTLTGISDGVQLINKTIKHLETCIAGVFAHPGEEDGFVRLAPVTVQTNDSTVTTIETIAIDDNTVYLFDSDIVGETTDHLTVLGIAKIVTVKRVAGGGAVLVGAITNKHIGKDSGAGAWSTTYTVSGNNLIVQVQGPAATTIDWKAYTKYVKF